MKVVLKYRRSAIISLSLCLGVSAGLSGCAGSLSFREGRQLLADGKIEPGLAKLEEATKLDPRNAEYKIILANNKMAIVQSNLRQADIARSQLQLDQAEQLLQNVLKIEPNNSAAKSALELLQMDRQHQRQIQQAEQVWKKAGKHAAEDAQEILRLILQENPQHRAALALKAEIKQKTKKAADGKLASAFRKQITLEFRDAPLRSIFDVMARVSGLNFIFDKEVRPDLRATILVKNISIEEALHMLLTSNQLEQAVLNENSIMVYPNSPLKLKEYQQLNLRTFFLANGDVKTVAYTIKTLLKARDVVTDERLGLIIMRDTPEMLRMAERIIAVQDLPDPEVMLEVEVLEIQRSRLTELGIRWPESATLSLAGVNRSIGTTNQLLLEDLRNINRGNINLSLPSTKLNARREASDSNILANPRIRVRNKEKAKIMIGDRVPVITTTSTATGFVADSVAYVDVGLKLDVEPHIYLDDEVAIKLNLEVSNLVKEVISKSGTQSYQIGTRNATTVLRLKDGETQILAGLISDEERSTGNKVPGIGELPILGRLFGSGKDTKDRSEIVLSITPHLIRSLRRPDLDDVEFPSGSENRVGQGASFGGGNNSAASDSSRRGDVPSPGSGPGMTLPRRTPMTGGNDDGSFTPPSTVTAPPSLPAPAVGEKPQFPPLPQDAPSKPPRKTNPAEADKK